MKIYYGKFMENNKYYKNNTIYYRYFNSKESIYNYKNMLSTLNSKDILLAIGEAKFNKAGLLYEVESEEEKLYDIDKGEEIKK